MYVRVCVCVWVKYWIPVCDNVLDLLRINKPVIIQDSSDDADTGGKWCGFCILFYLVT